MGIPVRLTCLLRNLYAGQIAAVRTRHGTADWFQIGIRYLEDVICHPAYLASMQITSCEMLGWMRHNLESRQWWKISVTLETQMTPPLWQKVKRNWRTSWWGWKEESEKAGLTMNIQKAQIMASGPITSWQINAETMEIATDHFLGLQNHGRW